MPEPIKVTFIADDKGVVTTTKEIEAAQKEFSKNATAQAKSYVALEKQKANAVKQATKEQVAAIKEQQRVEKERRQQVKQFASDFTSAFAIATGVVVAFGAAAKKAWDFSMEGAAIDQTMRKFDRLTDSVNTSSAAMLGDLRKATRGLYDDSQLIASATDFMSLGLAKSHDEVVRLSAVASALNMNMNQLTLTLTNKTTMRFDTLGVAVDGFDEKVQKLVDSGMDADAAFNEAFLQQAEEQIAKVGHAADTTAGSMQRFESGLKNEMDILKRYAADSVAPTVTKLNEFFDARNRATLAVENAERAGLSQAQAMEQGRIVMAGGTSDFEDMAEALDILDGKMRNVAEVATPQLVSEFGGLLSITQSVSKDVQRLREQEQGLREDFSAGKISLDEMNDALRENAAQFEESTNIRILKRAEEMLAADGLTIQEEQALLDRGLAMGVYTQEYVDNANIIIRESQSLADAINAIPSNKTINVSASWSTGAIANAANWDPSQYHRADGGPVSRNTPYIVGERGPEMFVPSSSGNIVPNNQLQGGGETDALLRELVNKSIDVDMLTMAFRDAMMLGAQ